ncbi:type II secretory pathway protein [Neptunicella sp. SCSIO 80796]|uniref:type II secretory pathway protein n=1 Tax=Neptunicella plasticusilytica TaxID=3117012 RepID=UPI003A4DA470
MKSIFPMHLKQTGSMLVISIFIIIVMTVLGLAMTSMLSTSADSVVTEVYGVRAQQAARTGLEQHLLKVFPANDDANLTACETVQNHIFAATPGLQNCEYTSRCTPVAYTLSTGNVTSFNFTSEGKCESGTMTVSRTIKVDALDRP